LTCPHTAVAVTCEKLPIERVPRLFAFRLMVQCATCGTPFEFLGPIEGNPLIEPLVNPDSEGTIIEIPAVARGTPMPRGFLSRQPGSKQH
jgi:hypothetical protein